MYKMMVISGFIGFIIVLILASDALAVADYPSTFSEQITLDKLQMGLDVKENQTVKHSIIEITADSVNDDDKKFHARRKIDIDGGGWIAVVIFLAIGLIIVVPIIAKMMIQDSQNAQKFRKSPHIVRDIICTRCFTTPYSPENYRDISARLINVGDTDDAFTMCFQYGSLSFRKCPFKRIKPRSP